MTRKVQSKNNVRLSDLLRQHKIHKYIKLEKLSTFFVFIIIVVVLELKISLL
jgi:hypothetical protein